MTKLILLRGLPGSGKSTEARRLLAAGVVEHHFEADMYFEKRGIPFDGALLPAAHYECYMEAMDCLLVNESVVVSNTFTTMWEMLSYLEAARELGIEVEVRTMRGNWPSTHNVPEETMERMRRRFVEYNT